jgi:ABC-type uncharacterized transport system ATPase subunit
MIELQNVSFKFNKQVHVLDQANYLFQKGVFYAFSGSTEAARNATFSLMCGLIEPEIGRIIFNGKNIKQIKSEELLSKHIGFHNQHNRYIEYLNVERNIILAMGISVPDIKNKKDLISDSLLENGLDDKVKSKKLKDLGPYQRFLVDITIVTLCEKELILLNGPSKLLNEEEVRLFVSWMRRLAHDMGKCVILTTDSKEVAKLADKIVVLKNGKLI